MTDGIIVSTRALSLTRPNVTLPTDSMQILYYWRTNRLISQACFYISGLPSWLVHRLTRQAKRHCNVCPNNEYCNPNLSAVLVPYLVSLGFTFELTYAVF